MRYKRIGYNADVMRQSACLVVNPVRVYNFAVLFNCMPVGRGLDSRPNIKLTIWLVWAGHLSVSLPIGAHLVVLLLFPCSSGGVTDAPGISRCLNAL